MDYKNLIAIDIHTHAEVSCRNPFDNYGEEYDRAADKFFGSDRRPTIDETVAYYREKKIGLVMLTVDSESQLGRRRQSQQRHDDRLCQHRSPQRQNGRARCRATD